MNAGDGDNTRSDYPCRIELDSYSIVNQKEAQWQWTISPQPLSVTSLEVRNPVITIDPNQSYDISLTVTTPAGSDTKTIKSMIKGAKPVPDEDTDVYSPAVKCKDLLLLSGNVVNAGEPFVFVPQSLAGKVALVVYDAKGAVVNSTASSERMEVATAGFAAGVYFYMAEDEAGYKESGKLLVK